MRIAVDAGVLCAYWGGIPKYVDRLVRGLVAGGDRVDLLANVRRIPHQIDGANDVGLRVKGLAVWREVAVPAWLAVNRPDVMWAPATHLPRLLPVPSVVTVHDLAPMLFPGIKPASEEREFARELKRSARKAARVIAVSQTTAGDAVRLWQLDPGKVRVVPLGVDESFTPGDRAAAQAQAAERWGLTAPWVLALGSLEPRKGLRVLVDAARSSGSWQVALAGHAAFEGDALVAAARESGVCRVLGPVDDADLPTLYRAADLLAVPSLYEGFGLPSLEAMACGTPVVIAGGSGGLEEISGPAAAVVAERTPEAWAAAIDGALARREELVARSIAHAGRFRWEDAVRATRAVLADAARSG